ncbi:FAD/NAD(P)-binding protein [Aureibaculum flavum]|uniref:FAD/NAD(P)-binding protein n=1 Tax=Aureibaculum flavum TaxID=2795986 RepID=UPI001E3EE470|nr:FAD/NAD(P)-binding protein [Aureibaculum flavum]
MNYLNKNNNLSNKRVLGIIGMGPRGLYALENLIIGLSEKNSLKNIHLLLFEETEYFGNGAIYRLNQVETNWINISERILILESRPKIILDTITIPKFPSYHEWISKEFSLLSNKEPDNYPPRAKVGAYLHQRFETFIKPLLAIEMVTLFKEKVQVVDLLENNKLKVETNLNTYDYLDEILLTIGHQPTALSKQLIAWEKYAQENENVTLLKAPYPIQNILNCSDLDTKNAIGVRGFGLAMIDVVRGIASEYGNFTIIDEQTQACEYTTTFDIKNWFIPFSLDGLPPAPKPLNAEIDELFKPSLKHISNFEDEIGNPSLQRSATNSDF